MSNEDVDRSAARWRAVVRVGEIGDAAAAVRDTFGPSRVFVVSMQQSAAPRSFVRTGVMIAAGLMSLSVGCTEASSAGQKDVAVVVAPEVAAPARVEPARAVIVPSETPAVRAYGLENARRALEAHRGEFVRTCLAAAGRQPGEIPLTFNLSFTPDGELVGVGIVEDRRVNDADVGTCLRKIQLRFKIPAPGVPLFLEVPFTLP